MDPIQMMMYQLMQGGMGGTPAGAAAQQPVQNAAQQMPQGAPESYRGGIIPMMANGQMGTVGDDLTRSAAGADLGWMDQFGKFLDGMDPNLRLMMGLQGAGNLGRILGGGA